MQPGDHLTSSLGENFAIGELASHVGMPAKYHAIVSMSVSEKVVPLVATYPGYRPKNFQSLHGQVQTHPIAKFKGEEEHEERRSDERPAHLDGCQYHCSCLLILVLLSPFVVPLDG